MDRQPVGEGTVEPRANVPEVSGLDTSERRFRSAAAAFERAKPWSFIRDSQLIELQMPALGWDRACASVTGAAGESYGLLLLRSLDDYVTLTRLDEAGPQAGDRLETSGVAVFSVGYERPRGKSGGGSHAPFILKLSAEHLPQPLTEADYQLATVALDAVRGFAEGHRQLFREPSGQPVEQRIEVSLPSGQVEVMVTAPPSGLPWVWGRERPRDGLRRQQANESRDRFLADRRARGAADPEVERTSRHVTEAIAYRLRRGEPIVRWTAEDVQAYLLDFYPAQGTAPDDDLPLIPESLDLFLEWLARADGAGDVATLASARERITRCRDAFLRYAGDPRRFSAAKTLSRAATAEGVDLDDEKAVDAFVKRFKRRLARDPSLLPADGNTLGRKAWVWTPDQPPPDPQGPCPCGSGKRYRRCCMPR